VEEGVFELTRTFYESRGEGALHSGWTGGSGDPATAPMTEKELAHLRHAEQHLRQGTSVVVPTQSDSGGAPEEIMRFARALRPETRRTITICTFTNVRSDRLLHFGPAFCALYSTTMNRSLADVLGELVPLDDQGSPFKAIRRKSG
jgi:hypothetical protein